MKILSCLASVNCFISLLTRCPENVDRYPKMWINARKCGSISENVDQLPEMWIKSISRKCGVSIKTSISVWSTGGEDLCDPASAAQWFYSTNQNVPKELQLSTIIFLLTSDNESLSNLVTYRVNDLTDNGFKLKMCKVALKSCT